MNEDECEGMGEEDKVNSSITKESGPLGTQSKEQGTHSELAEKIYPSEPVGFTIVQHHLIRVLKF